MDASTADQPYTSDTATVTIADRFPKSFHKSQGAIEKIKEVLQGDRASIGLVFNGAERTPLIVPVLFKKLSEGAIMPTRAHETDAAWDLYLPDGIEDLVLEPGDEKTLGLKIAIAIPYGWCFHILSRSSTAPFVYHGLVDAGYRGELGLRFHNPRRTTQVFRPGDRVAQAWLQEVVGQAWIEVTELPESDRGEGGWGSTGR